MFLKRSPQIRDRNWLIHPGFLLLLNSGEENLVGTHHTKEFMHAIPRQRSRQIAPLV